MAELNTAQKLQIVQALAIYTTPTEVSVMMKEEYGLDVSAAQVVKYDCTKPSYEAGEKWREIFEQARKNYIQQVAEVPVANQGYRLRVIQKGVDEAIRRKNFMMAASLCEQAAKEVGGVLTNERNVRMDDNRDRGYKDLTPEERRDMVAQLFTDALAKDEQQTAETTATVQ